MLAVDKCRHRSRVVDFQAKREFLLGAVYLIAAKCLALVAPDGN